MQLGIATRRHIDAVSVPKSVLEGIYYASELRSTGE